MKRSRGKPKRKRRAEESTAPDSPTESAERRSLCPLVAIGASAGGLEVFQQFFAYVPPDTGLAFVLIQHLDPNHETLIPELLTKYTPMPVQRLLEPIIVEPVAPEVPYSLHGLQNAPHWTE